MAYFHKCHTLFVIYHYWDNQLAWNFMKRVSLMTIKKSLCLGSFWSVQREVLVHSLGTTHSGKSVIFKNGLKAPNLSEALRYGKENTPRHSNPTLFLHISTEHIAAFSATKFHSFQICTAFPSRNSLSIMSSKEASSLVMNYVILILLLLILWILYLGVSNMINKLTKRLPYFRVIIFILL